MEDYVSVTPLNLKPLNSIAVKMGERFHVADIDWVKQVKLKDHMALCL